MKFNIHPKRIISKISDGTEVISVKKVSHGGRKETSIVKRDESPDVVVQTSPDIESLRSEAAIVRMIRENTTVPVPQIYAGGVVNNSAYIVVEKLPGENMHSIFTELRESVRHKIIYLFGRFLAKLHTSFSMDVCGAVRPTGDKWQNGAWPTDRNTSIRVKDGKEPSSWIEQYATTTLDRLPTVFDEQAHRVRKHLSDVSVTEDGNQAGVQISLFPWDLRPGNALIYDGEISAIIDWELPMAAPTPLAVAKCEYLVAEWYTEDAMEERDTFRGGYQSVREYPDIHPVFRCLGIAASAVDSDGDITKPLYPELGQKEAIEFHQKAIERVI